MGEIEAALAELEGSQETAGSVALMFGGAPVLGSRAIDADFASKAVAQFQDLITKRVAVEERGKLGARGKIPLRTSTSLGISSLVRGSVGFVLEELDPNTQLTDSAVKQAIDEVTDVIAKTAAADEAQFEQAVESLDGRVLLSLRDFFRTLDESRASVRIVEDERDELLDTQAVQRGRVRIDAIDIRDLDEQRIRGELIGLLPEGRKFELKLESGDVIKGSVATALSREAVERGEGGEPLLFKRWLTKMKVREIRERNKEPRYVYTLLGLLERLD